MIEELEGLIQMMEARIPANPRSPENEKHEKRLEREMRRYFRDLEQAFPYEALERIYGKAEYI